MARTQDFGQYRITQEDNGSFLLATPSAGTKSSLQANDLARMISQGSIDPGIGAQISSAFNLAPYVVPEEQKRDAAGNPMVFDGKDWVSTAQGGLTTSADADASAKRLAEESAKNAAIAAEPFKLSAGTETPTAPASPQVSQSVATVPQATYIPPATTTTPAPIANDTQQRIDAIRAINPSLSDAAIQQILGAFPTGGQVGTGQVQPAQQTAAQPQTYVVKAGDTLSKIAKQFGVPMSSITGYKSGNPNLIRTGEKLTIGGQQPQQEAPKITPAQILPSYGVDVPEPAVATAFQLAPERSFEELYKDLSVNLGLPTLKTQIEATSKELQALRDKKTEEATEINNNPWISETLRIKKLGNLDSKYSQKEGNLLSTLEIAQNQYDTARDEAKYVATTTLNQYNAERQFQQEQLEFLLQRADKALEREKPIEVSAGATLFDPATGQAIFTAPKATGSGGGGSGLTPAQINSTVNSIAGAFDNEQIVKSYNVTQEGYQTIKTIGTKTSSPADDIAFIYAFAKIMDPNSVVREGEYATIQKYAQTWSDNFGFKAKRIFSNTNFLSSDAKQKMLNALAPKVATIEKQYVNLKSEYQRQIDDAYGGKPRTITSYETPSSAKGTLSDKQFVEKTLTSQGIKYNDFVAKIPKGKIAVVINDTGEIATITEQEFNGTKFTRI